MSTSILYLNNHTEEGEVSPNNANKNAHRTLELDVDQHFQISSYLGHIFTANEYTPPIDADADDGNGNVSSYGDNSDIRSSEIGAIIDFMSVSETEYVFHKTNRLESCELLEQDDRNRNRNINGGQGQGQGHGIFINDGSVTCDNMNLRFAEFKYNVYYHKRLGLNYIQPQMIPAGRYK